MENNRLYTIPVYIVFTGFSLLETIKSEFDYDLDGLSFIGIIMLLTEGVQSTETHWSIHKLYTERNRRRKIACSLRICENILKYIYFLFCFQYVIAPNGFNCILVDNDLLNFQLNIAPNGFNCILVDNGL